MVRRMIPVAGSRFARMELEFQTDAEASDWAKAMPQDGSAVLPAWNGRKVTLTSQAVIDFEAKDAGKAPPAPAVPPVEPSSADLTAFTTALETMGQPDLDVLRQELGLKRIGGETPAELKLRLRARKRDLLAKE